MSSHDWGRAFARPRSRSAGDLRTIAERWLTPEAMLDESEIRETIALRFAIERALWSFDRWLESEARLREAVLGPAAGKGYPEFDPDQPRDDRGRWTDAEGPFGGGDGTDDYSVGPFAARGGGRGSGGGTPKNPPDTIPPKPSGAPSPTRPPPEPTPGQIRSFEQQIEKYGIDSLLRSRRTLQKRLEEHEAKLPGLPHPRGVEQEIQNFRQQIEAIDRILARER